MNQPRRLCLGNASVDLLESKQHEFLGLGGVTITGVPLRNAAWPITVRLDTPDGILYARLLVEKVRQVPVGAASPPRPGQPIAAGTPLPPATEIVLQAIGVPWERGEYHDDFSQPVLWLQKPDAAIVDRLTLVLRPVALALGGRQWTGFSYQFEFTSRYREIHRLLTHATWEIGGRITGNTVLSQGQCNIPVYRGAKNRLFTTACLRTLDQYGKPQGNSFQLGPRAGLIQGFDFQHARQGALFQWWPGLESISSLIESPRGSDLLHVVDEYRFALTKRAQTPSKWVLFTPGLMAEHEARDLWWDCLQHVYGGIRKYYRVVPTTVVPEAYLTYETVIDGRCASDQGGRGWQLSVNKAPAQHQGRLRLNIAGVEVDHAEAPYAIADHLLPRLAAQGIKRFRPEAFSESDVTVLGLKRKLDNGLHGNLHCSSTCATHRFFPSEYWGGIKAWRYMYEKGQRLGLEIGAWFAPHFSARCPIFQAHPEYRMIDVLGFPAGGGLGPETMTVADWNTGIRQWVLDDLKRWQEEGGLDWVDVDSYSSFGLLQMNYAARMRTNFDAFARTLAAMQQAGIASLEFESVSALGASHFGLADLRGDRLKQDKAVAGQNDFGWWVGAEDMAYNCSLLVPPRHRGVAELKQIMFRVLANRGGLGYQRLFDVRHILPKWWTQLNHLYNQALPHMQGRRRLLPDGVGVRWESANGDLIWTFQNGRASDRRVRRLDGKTEHVWTKPVLPAWNVFRITKQSAEK